MSSSRSSSGREVVEAHQRSLSGARRRRLGVHYTPEALARRLVDLALSALGSVPRVVCDPSCGAGAILLAAADRLAAMGVAPEEVVTQRLLGVEVDPDAAGAAIVALQRWAADHGTSVDAAHLSSTVVVADSLGDPSGWESPVAAHVDVVVGNPPFLSPLATDTSRRTDPDATALARSAKVGPYTDSASIHLLAAVELVSGGGTVCMLQPQSVLGGRDSAPVRSAIAELAHLVALWAGDSQWFEAQVNVCAPVLRRRVDGSSRRGAPVELRWNDDDPVVLRDVDPEHSWAPLLGAALGVPAVPRRPGAIHRTIGDAAVATAGFRDEFYALAAAAVDRPDVGLASGESSAGDRARLVTSGMIDPAQLRWGDSPRRLGGTTMLCPQAALDVVAAHDARVGRWARQRLVPKVLVASQTKVIEACTDTRGDCLPVTPVVSVEPRSGEVDPAMLACVLGAPSSSALMASVGAGTGRSSRALRISASAIAALPLPASAPAWQDAARSWESHEQALADDPQRRSDRAGWKRLGAALDSALGVKDDDVQRWWVDRLAGVPGGGEVD